MRVARVCRGAGAFEMEERSAGRLRAGDQIVPQRYPCGAGDGTERSTRCGGGSCAAGTATRTCRSGSGRSCCRHGRRACPRCCSLVSIPFSLQESLAMGREGVPASSIPSILLMTFDAPEPPTIHPLGPSLVGNRRKSYLSRVDPLARENVVVGAHLERLLLAVADFFSGVVDVAWWSAVGVGEKGFCRGKPRDCAPSDRGGRRGGRDVLWRWLSAERFLVGG
jgi:hypothetical protein